MKITKKLLEEWGVPECKRGDDIMPWFEKEFPKGIEDTPEGLINRMPDEWEFDKLWLLQKIAEVDNGKDAYEALDLLITKADPSRLANVINKIKDKDTSKVLNALLDSEDVISLKSLIDHCDDDKKIEKALEKIYQVGNKETIDHCEKTMPSKYKNISSKIKRNLGK